MSLIRNFLFNSGNHPGLATNLGLLAGRLGFGLMLAVLHGWGKLPPSEGFIGGVGNLGFPAPALFAWLAALAEFLGSLFVAIGLLTRPAAFMVAFTMFTAAFLRHGPDPFEKKELALVYLTFALIYLLAGAGRFSVDWVVSHKRSKG